MQPIKTALIFRFTPCVMDFPRTCNQQIAGFEFVAMRIYNIGLHSLFQHGKFINIFMNMRFERWTGLTVFVVANQRYLTKSDFSSIDELSLAWAGVIHIIKVNSELPVSISSGASYIKSEAKPSAVEILHSGYRGQAGWFVSLEK